MMEVKIVASVGENAKNKDSDVRTIQIALNQIMQYNILAPLAPLNLQFANFKVSPLEWLHRMVA